MIFEVIVGALAAVVFFYPVYLAIKWVRADKEKMKTVSEEMDETTERILLKIDQLAQYAAELEQEKKDRKAYLREGGYSKALQDHAGHELETLKSPADGALLRCKECMVTLLYMPGRLSERKMLAEWIEDIVQGCGAKARHELFGYWSQGLVVILEFDQVVDLSKGLPICKPKVLFGRAEGLTPPEVYEE